MESANSMQIPRTLFGCRLQLRIPQQLNFTQSVLDSANTVADSAISSIFGAILSEREFRVIVRVHNSKENQRKVATMKIPRQI